ncbi:hypothetical protein ACP4OV_013146 [Aristida adscensionis]
MFCSITPITEEKRQHTYHLTMELTDSPAKALLDAHLDLWHITFAFMKSMALKSALDLRVIDAVHRNGGAASLPEIAAGVTLHPSKIPNLRRLMRVLTKTGVFSVHHAASDSDSDNGEPAYALTPVSRLLAGSPAQNMVPFAAMLLHPLFVSSFFDLGAWFQRAPPDPCIFKHAHGRSLWEMAGDDAAFDALVNDAMAADSRFTFDIVVREYGEVFQGIGSLVDVAGGVGAAAQAISKAFPDVRCSVLDLEHVIASAPRNTDVQYITGDMFQSIPPADAMLLKAVLHDWDHDDCVKILKNCRKAISSRAAGGKVIILNIVVGAGPSSFRHTEMQAMYDLYMMIVNGMERDEQQWKNIFHEAGFSDYKITPVLGVRSIIEVYP